MMISRDRFAALQASVETLSDLHIQISFAIERVKTELALIRDDPVRHGSSQPSLDGSRFRVVWRRCACDLGPTKRYALLARLVRRPNHLFPYEQLLQDVWRSDRRSDDTVRSTICQLRTQLRRACMARLARSIHISAKHCGLILD